MALLHTCYKANRFHSFRISSALSVDDVNPFTSKPRLRIESRIIILDDASEIGTVESNHYLCVENWLCRLSYDEKKKSFRAFS